MIKVLFFARLREQLGTAELELEFTESLHTLASLQQFLVEQNNAQWQQALGADNVIRAVNQQVADLSRVLCDGDEVAFFPPVTGG